MITHFKSKSLTSEQLFCSPFWPWRACTNEGEEADFSRSKAGRSEWSSLQGLQAKMLKSTGKRRKRNLSESQRLSMIDSDDDV
jgi:hypothetical protein